MVGTQYNKQMSIIELCTPNLYNLINCHPKNLILKRRRRILKGTGGSGNSVTKGTEASNKVQIQSWEIKQGSCSIKGTETVVG